MKKQVLRDSPRRVKVILFLIKHDGVPLFLLHYDAVSLLWHHWDFDKVLYSSVHFQTIKYGCLKLLFFPKVNFDLAKLKVKVKYLANHGNHVPQALAYHCEY